MRDCTPRCCNAPTPRALSPLPCTATAICATRSGASVFPSLHPLLLPLVRAQPPLIAAREPEKIWRKKGGTEAPPSVCHAAPLVDQRRVPVDEVAAIVRTHIHAADHQRAVRERLHREGDHRESLVGKRTATTGLRHAAEVSRVAV